MTARWFFIPMNVLGWPWPGVRLRFANSLDKPISATIGGPPKGYESEVGCSMATLAFSSAKSTIQQDSKLFSMIYINHMVVARLVVFVARCLPPSWPSLPTSALARIRQIGRELEKTRQIAVVEILLVELFDSDLAANPVTTFELMMLFFNRWSLPTGTYNVEANVSTINHPVCLRWRNTILLSVFSFLVAAVNANSFRHRDPHITREYIAMEADHAHFQLNSRNANQHVTNPSSTSEAGVSGWSNVLPHGPYHPFPLSKAMPCGASACRSAEHKPYACCADSRSIVAEQSETPQDVRETCRNDVSDFHRLAIMGFDLQKFKSNNNNREDDSDLKSEETFLVEEIVPFMLFPVCRAAMKARMLLEDNSLDDNSSNPETLNTK